MSDDHERSIGEKQILLSGKIKQVYLDRPFVYAIIDVKTGVPLFIGAVQSL